MSNKNTLKASILISSPVQKVWQIITDPICIKEFYFDMDWKTDWQKGSPILITGTWDHEPFEDKATILDIAKEKFMEFNLQISGSPTTDHIRYELENVANGTLFTIYQYDLPNEATLKATLGKWNNVLYGIKQLAEK